uniref:Uncharacterized protein n=1 Tax=Nymphaea colorata TaxID=210225 RepID=A0A5K1ARN3_9MAGN
MEDPYASIAAHCVISDSQRKLLGDPPPVPPDCLGFSSPSDRSPSVQSQPVDGIFMCSPPDTPHATPPQSVPPPVAVDSPSTNDDPPRDPRVRPIVNLIRSFWEGREQEVELSWPKSTSKARPAATSGGRASGSPLQVANATLGLKTARETTEKRGSAVGSKRSRRLPASIVDKGKELAEESPEEARAEGLADLMGLLFDEADTSIGDVDILELSVKAGLTFPLPKWRR